MPPASPSRTFELKKGKNVGSVSKYGDESWQNRQITRLNSASIKILQWGAIEIRILVEHLYG